MSPLGQVIDAEGLLGLLLGVFALLALLAGGWATLRHQTLARLRGDLTDVRGTVEDLRTRRDDLLAERAQLLQLNQQLAQERDAARQERDVIAAVVTGEAHLVKIEGQLEDHHNAAMDAYGSLVAAVDRLTTTIETQGVRP